MYIANGLHKKIFSLDIEKILLEYNKIENCAVVPVSDNITFQKPVAYIVLKKGYNNDVIKSDIKTYCENNLPDGYNPTRFIYIDKLPLTKVGKVDYLTLEKLAEEEINGK